MGLLKINGNKGWIIKVLQSLLAIFLICITISPVLYIFLNSLKSNEEYITSKFAIPHYPIKSFISNLNVMKENGIFRYLMNSSVVAMCVVTLNTLFVSLAGFSFSKLKFPGKNYIYWGVIGLLAIPTQVFVVPLYVLYGKLNMVDNIFALALIYATLDFPTGSFLMTSFYRGIPNELLDSAQIDGANSFQIYYKIMLPLGRPAIIAIAIINFFWCWNDLFIALIFNRTHISRLITPFIAIFNEETRAGLSFTNWPLIFNGSIISLIIPLIIYMIFQNRLVEGLTVGAVKG